MKLRGRQLMLLAFGVFFVDLVNTTILLRAFFDKMYQANLTRLILHRCRFLNSYRLDHSLAFIPCIFRFDTSQPSQARFQYDLVGYGILLAHLIVLLETDRLPRCVNCIERPRHAADRQPDLVLDDGRAGADAPDRTEHPGVTLIEFGGVRRGGR
ncbi:uncharacterized protein CC84DRAFT_741112 [Paraphaeosphaeria sporulosa]|uniref:Uncharacterized protein n=1 Tax=Paraphaeosphaeria sporulosa TaxID=1460663 RepID=A0A177CGI1_9PLEO|nr:uncharacterized protein CC84DRAFT_741112 [Paraphaeosphaeria sporulosa]OAG05938.1 hypothetical protein CC84DRAFT_741112 [Paraphaeosphaeria sporulosa]